ncbi:MAG: histone deacetylase, partial [Nitrospirae bacterium]|nr:histone deacetylase [Nitrospirota bacterium]
FTLNVPLPAGSGDEDYLEIFRKVLRPALRAFRPEFLLVSAGFDAHREDPLAQMGLTETGYYDLTREILSAALESGHRRLVSVLEGGYHLQALARSVEAHLRALMEDEVLPSAQHAND